MAKKEKAPKPEKPVKEKKAKPQKKKKGEAQAPAANSAGAPTADGATTQGAASVPLSNLSPEQMTAAQIEQAIKESNDPANRLKKLRSPINVRSCLLNILILIVATLAVVILWCSIAVDKFNFVHVMSDMFDKFGISAFFQNIGKTISGWFK